MIGPSIDPFWMPSFSLFVLLFSSLPRRNNYIFLVQDPIWLFFLGGGGWAGGVGGNIYISSKKCHIDLKFWPQVALIAVQMSFKLFLKIWIFLGAGHTQNVSFWSSFDPNLLPEDSRNQQQQLSYSNLLLISGENYDYFLLYLGFLGCIWTQG